jgi:hypothetical protein
MQRNTIFFIVVTVLHVSGGFPAHHQELKNCIYSIWYLLSLVAATRSVVEISTRLRVAATKFNKHQMLYVQFLSSWWWVGNRLKHVEL